MIEGQEDVTWADWQALAHACEESGIETLFRSDHYLSVFGRSERGSLDAWGTINALAAITSKVRLGTLVSPATFRHPAELAKVVVTADHVSGGRVELGLGTGWNKAEHEVYGFPFPPMGERMKNMEAQLQLITSHWSDDGPAQPKPVQRPRPNLIVGGRGGPRSIRMAARYADEYNTVNKTAAECEAIREQLDAASAAEGRDPIPLSLMTGWLAGEDRGELLDRAGRLAEWQARDVDPETFLAELPESSIAGTIDQNLEHLHGLAAAGVERVMLQHLLHRDLDAVEQIGRRVVPALVDGVATRE
jgi:alkanesulfonate monooxygenase SsuD/methylene tetrahydromethanopterin reductase-like flavin-dependent oxidoreductase (luciferase family)